MQDSTSQAEATLKTLTQRPKDAVVEFIDRTFINLLLARGYRMDEIRCVVVGTRLEALCQSPSHK